MADNPMVKSAAKKYFRRIKSAAQTLRTNPPIPWSGLDVLTRDLRLVEGGEKCPTFEQFMHFLRSISHQECRDLFLYTRFLMETYTSQKVSFSAIMEYFVRNESANDGLPSIPGVPPKVYSSELWRLVKQIYLFQSLIIRPIRRSVFSSSRLMIVSQSTQDGFYFCCVMHRMNPRLKVLTVSPGMCYIACIFAKFFGLNPRTLQMMLQNI